MLTLLLATPFVAAFIVGGLPGRVGAWRRPIALLAALLILAQGLYLLGRFDPAGGFQFFETHVWNPRLGSAFSLAVDGLALALVLLAALLFLAALLAFRVPASAARLHYTLLLWLEGAALGVFMARDWSLFYVFWELTLIPLFFLIERLGGAGRGRAALNFVLYTLGGSVFMLVALLLLYDAAPGHSFDMTAMAAGGHGLAVNTQMLIFLGLCLGFAVKMGLFPLHGWMPQVYREAPPAVPLLSSGVLLKMGAYGVVRAVETLPGAALALQQAMSWLALLTVVYGAVLAWQSRDLIGMAAYASISHMGVVLLGVATLQTTGITGAALQMLAHGLAAGLIFLLIGLHRHSALVSHHAGLWHHQPRLAALLIIALVLGVGLPGSLGFVAELHVLAAGFASWGGRVALVSLAVLIGAAWVLREVSAMLTKPAGAAGLAAPAAPADMGRLELLATVTLLVLGVGFAWYPAPLLTLAGGTAQRLAQLFVPIP